MVLSFVMQKIIIFIWSHLLDVLSVCANGVYFKGFSVPVSSRLSLISLLSGLVYLIYVEILYPFGVLFCAGWWIWIYLDSSICGCSVDTTFWKGSLLFPCTSVFFFKTQVSSGVWNYVYVFNEIPLINVPFCFCVNTIVFKTIVLQNKMKSGMVNLLKFFYYLS